MNIDENAYMPEVLDRTGVPCRWSWDIRIDRLGSVEIFVALQALDYGHIKSGYAVIPASLPLNPPPYDRQYIINAAFNAVVYLIETEYNLQHGDTVPDEPGMLRLTDRGGRTVDELIAADIKPIARHDRYISRLYGCKMTPEELYQNTPLPTYVEDDGGFVTPQRRDSFGVLDDIEPDEARWTVQCFR